MNFIIKNKYYKYYYMSYYQLNKERILDYQKLYYEKNKETINIRQFAYHKVYYNEPLVKLHRKKYQKEYYLLRKYGNVYSCPVNTNIELLVTF